MIPHNFHESWHDIVREPLQHDFMKLMKSQYLPNILGSGKRYFPAPEQIFKAFNLPVEAVKVVIIGQDPYNKEKQANGIAFAVNQETKITPDLKVFENTLRQIVGEHYNIDKTLKTWSGQGVLLLNSALTVEEKKPNSHIEWWKLFMSKTISNLSASRSGIVYVSMGIKARDIIRLAKIDVNTNSIIHVIHPSQEVKYKDDSFTNNRVFEKINNCLTNKINW